MDVMENQWQVSQGLFVITDQTPYCLYITCKRHKHDDWPRVKRSQCNTKTNKSHTKKRQQIKQRKIATRCRTPGK